MKKTISNPKNVIVMKLSWLKEKLVFSYLFKMFFAISLFPISALQVFCVALYNKRGWKYSRNLQVFNHWGTNSGLMEKLSKSIFNLWKSLYEVKKSFDLISICIFTSISEQGEKLYLEQCETSMIEILRK